uniref:Brown planthopper resistance protein BPH1/9 n=1 Tax=Oryza sativa subsp. indica TaxID=39946 RepID=A0A2Z2CAE8_ORYSI|nr:brown planthopper resistance protein BPH1/9 [Oryza sativa Indica Group]AOX14125.1 brown planthopper resistance protein BPH1/9 [Oryza sativa Indica Group]AOX14126.1 brown planthopper resistance protein BPH1/9 [Oryza sativa Indica Group]AOX14127.1 brown planthopper resistance protein BPH1/9 [Oryza sativa Indica Group]AOX14128.1 brown planthopper resistance protein BPH1/9 [Oryza sativa Indica Group]
MEATAVSIGRSVLKGALGFAKSTLVEEVSLQLGVQRDQAFIRDELEMMNSFLMAANDEKDDNKVVRTWVKQVRDVAYDVEDCLQDFAVRLGGKSSTWWLSPHTLWERRRIAKQMKELRGKVEDVSQRNMRYQLIKGSKPTVATNVTPSSTARATMSGAHEERWQHEKAIDHLVRLVKTKVDERRVIAVWGTSGDIREMSIVGGAYDHLKRNNKFECYAWVNLMHPLNPTKLLQTIVRQFYVRSLQEAGKATPSCQILSSMLIKEDQGLGFRVLRSMLMKEDHLNDEFNKYLSDKCYLIVLNDLSTAEEWKQIKMLFPDNKKGSRIIVFTQQVEVASFCARTEEVAPEHMQLFADQTLYAFHCKGAKDGVDSMEDSSNLNEDTTYNAVEGKSLTRTYSMVTAFKESEIVGRVDEIKEIIELISKGSQQLEKISVWGMGGIGKTTLIQNVYRSEKVKKMFDKHACVTIMRPFNLNDLLMSLVRQLEDSKTSGGKELVSILEGKKYLIVLDDVLFTTEWDAIESYFPATETGSRIIITTRHESIAKHCSGDQQGKMYQLNRLGDNDAKNLFAKKVFKESVNLDQQDLELIKEAKSILKKCNGLPLAIVTIGGFLASRPKTTLEWRKLNEHISAELETNPGLEAIRAVLNISYDGLPYHLKSCFLYLSIFPEDDKISRKRLVRRWCAEGYSRELWDKSAEEIANNYFFELIDRSMILPTQKSTYSNRGADSCQVHDIMREIAISKSKEENLVLRLEGGRRLHNHDIVRHLSITNSSEDWETDVGELKTTVDMSRIRSLTVFGEWRPIFISDKMRLLRVLDLEDTEGVRNHHIKQIGELLHLRYLSLRGCTHIAYMPDSLGNLRQLETLDVRDTFILRLPKTITNLCKLKYLRASIDFDVYEVITEKLPELMRNRLCISTVALLGLCLACSASAIGKFDVEISTRDLCTMCCCIILPSIAMRLQGNGVVAPRGLRRLTALHTLGVVDISWQPSILQDIKRLIQLRKLEVTGVNKKNSKKLFSALAALSQLESLSLFSKWKPGLWGCLDAEEKFSPPKNLKTLKLQGNLVELPKWIGKLNNLVKLKLSKSRLKDHDAAIQVLGMLPNLTILCLPRKSFHSLEGGELNFSEGSFKSLVVLELHFGRSKRVKFQQGAFHNLELLELSGYIEVETKFSGLEFLPGIKEVWLQGESYPINEQATRRLKEDLLAQLSENPKKPILKTSGYF